MFNLFKSPQLPETTEAQAFRSIKGGPTLSINAINDRTHRMKLIPWEDILEVFPKAVYVRDSKGIVMPARDGTLKRISPRSIKLQADEVLEVISSEDAPPKGFISAIVQLTDKDKKDSEKEGEDSERKSTEEKLEEYRNSRSSLGSLGGTTSTTTASTAAIRAVVSGADGGDDDEWSPFQANGTGGGRSEGGGAKEVEVLRQEMVHRFELLSAEQEERMQVMIRACHRPAR